MEIYDDESVPSISSANEYLHSNNSLNGKLNSDEYFASKRTGPAMQANCDLESETQSDIKLESDQVENCLDSSQSSCTKTSHEMADTCRTFKSDPQVTTSPEKIVSSTSDLIHLNQSTCNIDESENVFAQKRLLGLCVTDVLSSVNKSEDDISDKAAHVSPNSCSKETLSISAIVKEQSSFMCDILTKNETTKPLSGICSLVQEQTEDCAVNQILDNSEMPKSILSVSSVTIHPSASMHAAEKQSTVLNGNSSTPCTSDHVVCNSMSSLNLSGSILDSNKSNDSNSETITKTKEGTDSDVQAASLPNENVANVMKATCVSATQKRKVSLSEYRMRMRESTNKNQSNSDTLKKSISAPAICATAIPEPLPELVTLAPLPLFDTGSSSPVHLSAKSSKKKKIVKSADEEINSDVIEHRENLTDRLKREFGFEDDSDVNNLIPAPVPQAKPICTQVASGSNTSILPLCAQPPPPPPPPPPRPPRPAQSTFGGASASPSQFGFPIASPFPQPSYVVSQVTGAQYIATQTPLSAPTLQPVHQINPSGVQGSVRPPLLPSPSTHSFRSPLPSGGLRPPVQHEYASANAQNFAALVQQPPPPPPPHKTYPHVYQSGLFK